ncbi:hypothetical protein [Methylobacterium oryzisoli]|uniref:hypothetical protein n=1 Tax=Methylobacterium oryzisoli TaxID=3385502 RepID=UPI0038924D65
MATTPHARFQPVPVLVPTRRYARAAHVSRVSQYTRQAPFLMPDEADEVPAWEVVQPVRPDTPHARALRFLNFTGELLSAALIIAGGVFAYGFLHIG